MPDTLIRDLVLAAIEAAPADRHNASSILADALEDRLGNEDALVRFFRAVSDMEEYYLALLEALVQGGGKFERKRLDRAVEEAVKKTTGVIYSPRALRQEHPEGEFDKQGRWYPSEEENCGDFSGTVRGPTRAYPYSYMLRARTRQHCRLLAIAGLLGHPIPPAIRGRIGALRNEVRVILSQ